MVNHFREHMKRPLIGIGHSMGGNNLVNLSIMHPRLFTSLILIDPVIARTPSAQGNFAPARLSAKRRDRWPSREAAAASFKRSKFYQTWDPRVLDLWIKYGLRNLPTLVYPIYPADTLDDQLKSIVRLLREVPGPFHVHAHPRLSGLARLGPALFAHILWRMR